MCPIDFADGIPSKESPTANHEAADGFTELGELLDSRPPAAEYDDDDSWLAEELELLAAVPGISELERQVFVAFMGWGEGDALSHVQAAQQHQIKPAEVRRIEKKLGRLMVEQKQRFRPKVFQLAPPEPGTLKPRDGEVLKETRDVLFLAKLLEDAAATGWFEHWRDAEGGHCYQAITKPESAPSKGRQHLKLKTLRQLIQDHGYLGVRRLCFEPNADVIKLPPGHVLTHPVQEGADSLLGAPLEQVFHSWASATPPVPLLPGQVLCPICGPETHISVSVSSRPKTWKTLCGRAYTVTCCSGCLGVLESRLTMMN